MGRDLSGTIRSFLIILALSTCCFTTAPPDLQARVEQLEKYYVEIKEHLEAKIIDLETKVVRLEAKVEKQDSLLAVLKKGHKPLKENVDINQHRRQNATLRTCHEIHVANPSYPSGMYWIDPDGQGIGDPPIYVYCEMEAEQSDVKGTTSILHDSESKMDIGNCTEPGCYSRPIKYYASDRQIEALIQLSSYCHQHIRYHCRKTPLNFDGIAYAWWNVKDGERHEFSDCSATCNELSDTEGYDLRYVVDNVSLPITRIHFSNPFKGFGQHQVSRLRCRGKAKTEAMPRSCEDLWRMGHNLNGIYSVKGAKQMETVFCQFDKRPNEQDFQKRIGYQDIKTRPVYFSVQRLKNFSENRKPIPFDRDLVNIGGAMDSHSGVFTAPFTGTYFFSFAGLTGAFGGEKLSCKTNTAFGGEQLSCETNTFFLRKTFFRFVGLVRKERIRQEFIRDTDYLYPSTITVQSTLRLQAGDKVWIEFHFISTYLYGTDSTIFSGWLLEEEEEEEEEEVERTQWLVD